MLFGNPMLGILRRQSQRTLAPGTHFAAIARAYTKPAYNASSAYAKPASNARPAYASNSGGGQGPSYMEEQPLFETSQSTADPTASLQPAGPSRGPGLVSPHDIRTWPGPNDTVLSELDSSEFDDSKYYGIGAGSVSQKAHAVLTRALNLKDIEITPDGLLYLPEIKYRRFLIEAFGPGGWGLVPQGPVIIADGAVTQEWGLVVEGRLASVARGEQQYMQRIGLATAIEACKSNALMRCCKDLGLASELWDPNFIYEFKDKHCAHEWATHIVSKKRSMLWRLKSRPFAYPYQKA